MSKHKFSTKNLDLPAISFPATKPSGSALSSSSTSRTNLLSLRAENTPMSRYKSSFLSQRNNSNNNNRLQTDASKNNNGSTVTSRSRILSSPRRVQLTTRNLRERPSRLGLSMSDRKPPREERRLGRQTDSAPRSLVGSHKRTHSSTSLQGPVFSPRLPSSGNKFGFEPITAHYNRTQNDDIMKRRKVVTFLDPLDKTTTPTASFDPTTRIPIDEMVISDSESEETPLKSKLPRSSAGVLATKRSTKSITDEKNTDSLTDKQLFSVANGTSEASAILDLECEIKQFQLDYLRKFKKMQEQVELQAKQIQVLQEDNKKLMNLVDPPKNKQRENQHAPLFPRK